MTDTHVQISTLFLFVYVQLCMPLFVFVPHATCYSLAHIFGMYAVFQCPCYLKPVENEVRTFGLLKGRYAISAYMIPNLKCVAHQQIHSKVFCFIFQKFTFLNLVFQSLTQINFAFFLSKDDISHQDSCHLAVMLKRCLLLSAYFMFLENNLS